MKGLEEELPRSELVEEEEFLPNKLYVGAELFDEDKESEDEERKKLEYDDEELV